MLVSVELLTIGIAVTAGFMATAVARAFALRFGILNAPNPIVADHTTSIPYLGGLGIAVGVYGALLVPSLIGLTGPVGTTVPTGLLVGGLLFLGVGLADDLLAFGAASKIVLQTGSAGAAIAVGGLTPAIAGNPLIDTAIACLWIVTVVNAVNFIDVSDGLAGTLAATTAALFALALGAYPMAALAVAGACIGFLAWNHPPARIFMGDAGSLFLGFMLAAFALTARVETTWWPFLPMLGLFLAVPLFDLVFQSTTRMIEGRPWWIGGPDSYALRLQKAGLSKTGVAALTVIVAAVAWGGAALLPSLPPVVGVALIALAGLAALAARGWLLRFRLTSRDQAKPDVRVTAK